MDQPLRNILDQIEDVLLNGGTLADDLWMVLTALRGPDNQDNNAKATTVEVRRLAFPRVAERVVSAGGCFGNLPCFSTDYEPDSLAGGSHFAFHVISAGEALNGNGSKRNRNASA